MFILKYETFPRVCGKSKVYVSIHTHTQRECVCERERERERERDKRGYECAVTDI